MNSFKLQFPGFSALTDYSIVWLALFGTCFGFLSFSGILLRDQLELIFANVTTIEKRDLTAWRLCWKADAAITRVKKKLVGVLKIDHFLSNSLIFIFTHATSGLALWHR